MIKIQRLSSCIVFVMLALLVQLGVVDSSFNDVHKMEQYGTVIPQNIISCNSYEVEKENEGYFTHVYLDIFGNPTIGVGFNLNKSGAKEQMKAVGADYDAVRSGKQDVTDSQIRKLFAFDMAEGVGCATRFTQGLSKISDSAFSALADMAFNMGCSKLYQFKKLHAALQKEDYVTAAAEMKASLWCKQVHMERCGRDMKCIQN